MQSERFPDQEDSLPGTKPRRQAPAGSHPGPGHTPYAWGSVSRRASWPPPQPPWQFSWGRCVRPRAGQLPGALVCAQSLASVQRPPANWGLAPAVAGAGAEPGAGGAAEGLGQITAASSRRCLEREPSLSPTEGAPAFGAHLAPALACGAHAPASCLSPAWAGLPRCAGAALPPASGFGCRGHGNGS